MAKKKITRICSIENCGRLEMARTFCVRHYKKWYKYGDPLHRVKFRHYCNIEDCNKSVEGEGLCQRHYRCLKRNGHPTAFIHQFGKGSTPEERFWSLVDKTTGQGPNGDCWEWTGGPIGETYGQTMFEEKHDSAHRIAWQLKNNRHTNQWILHSCDNKKCCNPNHLREGSHRDNVNDAKERGRYTQGMQSKSNVTKESVACIIKQLLNENYTVKQITQRLEVKDYVVEHIKYGKTFKWVT